MSGSDILFVEDEVVVVGAARRVLESAGLSLEAAADGDSARRLLERGTYRVMMLDLMLPGVAGLELLEGAVARHPAMPVIVTTGFATARKTVEVLQAGAFDFLPKPFDVAELLSMVWRALRSADRELMSGLPPGPPTVESHPLYHLGRHSWARIDDSGLATLGVTTAFVASVEGPLRVALRVAGSETVQGKDFARIDDAGGGAHLVWAPLSGRVVDSNDRLAEHPERLADDPFGDGWLTRIAPWQAREEVDELKVF